MMSVLAKKQDYNTLKKQQMKIFILILIGSIFIYAYITSSYNPLFLLLLGPALFALTILKKKR